MRMCRPKECIVTARSRRGLRRRQSLRDLPAAAVRGRRHHDAGKHAPTHAQTTLRREAKRAKTTTKPTTLAYWKEPASLRSAGGRFEIGIAGRFAPDSVVRLTGIGNRRRRGRIAKSLRRWMKRGAAVELSNAHVNQHKRMDRNRFKLTTC